MLVFREDVCRGRPYFLREIYLLIVLWQGRIFISWTDSSVFVEMLRERARYMQPPPPKGCVSRYIWMDEWSAILLSYQWPWHNPFCHRPTHIYTHTKTYHTDVQFLLWSSPTAWCGGASRVTICCAHYMTWLHLLLLSWTWCPPHTSLTRSQWLSPVPIDRDNAFAFFLTCLLALFSSCSFRCHFIAHVLRNQGLEPFLFIRLRAIRQKSLSPYPVESNDLLHDKFNVYSFKSFAFYKQIYKYREFLQLSVCNALSLIASRHLPTRRLQFDLNHFLHITVYKIAK